MAGSGYDSSDDGIEILDHFVGNSALANKEPSPGVSPDTSVKASRDIQSLDEEVS
jgi:hypothetical protein